MKNKVINCPTEELARKILSILNKQGCKWGDGDSLTGYPCWNLYKENTCYRIDEDKDVYYSDIEWYEREGYQIITAEEFIK